ncbi:S41 family peptidase [Limibacter armeniacum]|uniref:S41 family peptidase n=1 Tax=Limibacter armeniacum TaxID=466084 RepID=UPI002FE50676
MKKTLSITLISLLIFSCSYSEKQKSSLDGVWESIGSSRIIEIKKDSFQLYDFSVISCLPVRKGLTSEFDDAIKVKGDTLLMKVGVMPYYYKRVDSLPELCLETISPKKKSDPVYNFEVFAKTIEENYVFMKLNHLNWDSLYTSFKSKVTANTTDVELYQLMHQLLKGIHDNHGYLEASDAVDQELEKQEQSIVDVHMKEYGDFEIADMVAAHYLKEDLTKDSWLIRWGEMDNGYGYILIKAMWLFADLQLTEADVNEKGYVDAYVSKFHQMDEGQYIEQERKAVAKLMDGVIQDLKNAETILIDIRFNGGGQDAVSLEILSRLNNTRRKVITQKLKYKAGYSPINAIYLEAKDSAYQKPVFLLTSQQTASAAETMALAAMSLPNVKRIGAHTSGALSTALEKTLPNGWHFTISNELFMDTTGTFYENKGVPVNAQLDYPEDRQTFFRSVANDLEGDKKKVLEVVENHLSK